MRTGFSMNQYLGVNYMRQAKVAATIVSASSRLRSPTDFARLYLVRGGLAQRISKSPAGSQLNRECCVVLANSSMSVTRVAELFADICRPIQCGESRLGTSVE